MANNLDLDKIRSSADIVKVISNYLNVVPRGKDYLALCPFHNDSRPSLSISTSKQIYRCFVCNKGGNVFNFVQEYEKVGFIDAVIKVSQICNIDLPKSVVPLNKVDLEIEKLKEIVKKSCELYTYTLKNTPENSQVWNYLISRGLDKNIVAKYNLGFCVNDEKFLSNYLINLGYSEEEILESGVCHELNGEIKDRFRNRLLFPICDEFGNPVGFSGRIIDNSDEAKYINSPETKIFKKNQLLYNYHIAKENIKDCIYVVEGFTDAIALSKIDKDNVVATMGTALTQYHFKLLKKLNTKIVLSLDSDKAGQMATVKILDSAQPYQLNISIIDSLYDMDLDEIITTHGKDKLLKSLENQLLPMQFYFKIFSKYYDLKDYSQRKKMTLELSKRIAKLDAIDRDYYSNQLANLTGFSLEAINENILDDQLKNIQNNQKNTRKLNKIDQINEDKYFLMQKNIMSYFINFQEHMQELINLNIHFEDSNLRTLCDYIIDYYEKNNDINIADIATELNDRELINLLIDISLSQDATKEYDLNYINTYLKLFEIEGQLKELEVIKKNEKDINILKEIPVKKARLKQMKEEILKKPLKGRE